MKLMTKQNSNELNSIEDYEKQILKSLELFSTINFSTMNLENKTKNLFSNEMKNILSRFELIFSQLFFNNENDQLKETFNEIHYDDIILNDFKKFLENLYRKMKIQIQEKNSFHQKILSLEKNLENQQLFEDEMKKLIFSQTISLNQIQDLFIKYQKKFPLNNSDQTKLIHQLSSKETNSSKKSVICFFFKFSL